MKKNTKLDLIKRDLRELESYIKIMQDVANGTNNQKWLYGACVEKAEYWFENLKEDVKGEMDEKNSK